MFAYTVGPGKATTTFFLQQLPWVEKMPVKGETMIPVGNFYGMTDTGFCLAAHSFIAVSYKCRHVNIRN